MKKNLRLRKAFFSLALASTMVLVGCEESELAPEEDYDILNQNDNSSSLSSNIRCPWA